MATLHVRVTAEDIARGKPKNASRCPVALALARAARLSEVIVNPPACFLVLPHGVAVERWLPVKATLAIRAFEKGVSIEPFEFDLEDLP